MLNNMKLYSPQDNYKTHKLQVIARFAKVPLEFIPCDYKAGKDRKFLEQYPDSKLPALETEGHYLFGCSAISRYIADKQHSQLKVEGQLERAFVDQWIDFSDYEVDRYASALYVQILELAPYNNEKFNFAKKELLTALKIVDQQLRTRTFLVSQHLTVADICLASSLVHAFKLLLDSQIRQSLPNLTRWFNLISSLPPFQEFFGVVDLCKAAYKHAPKTG